MKTARIDYELWGILGLEKLYDEYATGRNLSFSIQELLSEKWVQLRFGEWRLALGHVQSEKLDEIIDDRLKEIIKFLIFVREKERQNYEKAIIVNPDNVLNDLRKVFSDIPNLNWFVENNILSKRADDYVFWKGYYHTTYRNQAAAKMWAFDVNKNDDSDKLRWLHLICDCYASVDLIKYLDDKNQTELLKWVVELAEDEKELGSIENEKRFIIRQVVSMFTERLNTYNFDTNNDYDYYDDFFERLEFADNGSYNQDFRETSVQNFIADILLNYFNFIRNDYKERAASVLKKFNGIGYFTLNSFGYIDNPDSLAELSMYGATKFLAVYLFLNYVENENKLYSFSLSVLDEMLDNIIGDKHYWLGNYNVRQEDNSEQISLIFQFIVRNSDSYKIKNGENVNNDNSAPSYTAKQNFYRRTLVLLLDKIAKSYENNKSILKRIVADLGLLIKSSKRPARDKAIAGVILIGRRLYSIDSPIIKDDVYNDILTVLNEFYQTIFKTDSHKFDVYLSSEYWCLPIWLDVYSLASDEDRENYITPLKISELNEIDKIDDENASFNAKHNARKRAIIQTGVLLGMTLSSHKNKRLTTSDIQLEEIVTALYACLERYQSDTLFDIFRILPRMDGLSQIDNIEILKSAGAFININHSGWKKFEKGLHSKNIEQLLVWYDFVVEESSKKVIHDILVEVIEKGGLLSEYVFVPEILTNIIYRNNIEGLYVWAIQELQRNIEHLEKSNYDRRDDRLNILKNELYSIYYKQDNKELIQSGDNLFFKAVLFMENENYSAACDVFDKLSKTQAYPAVYINLLNCYNHRIETKIIAPENDDISLDKLLSKSALVIESANTSILRWSEEDREYFAYLVIGRYSFVYGEDKEYEKKIENLYQINLNNAFSRFNFELPATSEKLAKIENIPMTRSRQEEVFQVLNEARSYPLPLKGCLYLRCFNLEDKYSESEAFEILLLKCVLDVLSSISNYSAQLHLGETPLPNFEDRYTELFCEIFNRAYGFTLSLNFSDQNKRGSTGVPLDNGGGIAEVDLTLRENGNVLTIGEAIRLDGMNRTSIKDHINKKTLPHRLGNLPLFFIIYYYGDDPIGFWNDYKNCLEECFKDNVKLNNSVPFEKCLLYQYSIFYDVGNTKVFSTDFANDNGGVSHLYHMFINVKNSDKMMESDRSKKD